MRAHFFLMLALRVRVLRARPAADGWSRVDSIEAHMEGLDPIPTGGGLTAMILDLNNPICIPGPK